MLAIVTLGMAKSSRKAVIKVIQVNSGMRLIDIPGSRNLRMVTTKLSEAEIDEIPSIRIPSAQKAMFGPGLHIIALPQDVVLAPLLSANAAYANQPAFGSPPNRKLEFMTIPQT